MDPEAAREYFEQVKRLDEEDGECVDCGKIYPQWASLSFGIYICLECSGVHRSLGVHLSFVRSLTMDSWFPEQLAKMKSGGNRHFKDWCRTYGVPLELPINDKYRIPVVQRYKDRIAALAAGTPFTNPTPGEYSNALPVSAPLASPFPNQGGVRAIGSSPISAPRRDSGNPFPSMDIQLPSVDTGEILASISSAWSRFSAAASETIAQIAPPEETTSSSLSSQQLQPTGQQQQQEHPQPLFELDSADLPPPRSPSPPPSSFPDVIERIEETVSKSLSSLWRSISSSEPSSALAAAPTTTTAAPAPRQNDGIPTPSWSQISSFWEKTKESFTETFSALSLDPTQSQPPSHSHSQSSSSSPAAQGSFFWDEPEDSSSSSSSAKVLIPARDSSITDISSFNPSNATSVAQQNANWLDDVVASGSDVMTPSSGGDWSDEEPVITVNPALMEETDAGPSESKEWFDW